MRTEKATQAGATGWRRRGQVFTAQSFAFTYPKEQQREILKALGLGPGSKLGQVALRSVTRSAQMMLRPVAEAGGFSHSEKGMKSTLNARELAELKRFGAAIDSLSSRARATLTTVDEGAGILLVRWSFLISRHAELGARGGRPRSNERVERFAADLALQFLHYAEEIPKQPSGRHGGDAHGFEPFLAAAIPEEQRVSRKSLRDVIRRALRTYEVVRAIEERLREKPPG